MIRVRIATDDPELDPLLLQPDLFGGPGQVVGEQGYLWPELGKSERKPAPEPVNPEQGEMVP